MLFSLQQENKAITSSHFQNPGCLRAEKGEGWGGPHF